MYSVILHRRARKFLSKLSKKDIRPIVEKIELLSRDPFSSLIDVKKLATTHHSYRLRVGSIRLVYEVDTKKEQIYIHDIDVRGSIY